MQALDRPMDKFLDYALWLTARDLQAEWLPAVANGRLDAIGEPSHLIFALQAVGTPTVVKPLLELLRSGLVPTDLHDGVLTTIASLGQPDDLGLVLQQAMAEGNQIGKLREPLLRSMIETTRQREIARGAT